MNVEHGSRTDPRIEHAIQELQGLIQQRWPDASFEVLHGDDPEGVYLWTTVDVEDPDVVLDPLVDRLLELQVEERLPVHVVPVRPVERVLDEMRARAQTRPFARHPSLLDLPGAGPRP